MTIIHGYVDGVPSRFLQGVSFQWNGIYSVVGESTTDQLVSVVSVRRLPNPQGDLPSHAYVYIYIYRHPSGGGPPLASPPRWCWMWRCVRPLGDVWDLFDQHKRLRTREPMTFPHTALVDCACLGRSQRARGGCCRHRDRGTGAAAAETGGAVAVGPNPLRD